MTNRSEEICKLLGIEPKVFLERKYKNGRIPKNCRFLISSPVKRDIEGYSTKTGFCRPMWDRDKIINAGFLFCDKEIKVYPDMYEPSNFLKLMEFTYKYLQDDFVIKRPIGFPDKTFRVSNETYCIENVMNEFYDGNSLQECFISAVSRVLPSYCEQIKQKAQLVDWDYSKEVNNDR